MKSEWKQWMSVLCQWHAEWGPMLGLGWVGTASGYPWYLPNPLVGSNWFCSFLKLQIPRNKSSWTDRTCLNLLSKCLFQALSWNTKRQTVHLLAPHQYHLKPHSEDGLAALLMRLISLYLWMDINNCAVLALTAPTSPARQIISGSFPRFGFRMQTPFMVTDCSKGQVYNVP